MSIIAVYCTHTGRVRSVTAPTKQGEQIQATPPPMPTEGVHTMPIAAARASLDSVQKAVNQVTGLSPGSDRHALIDAKGNVVAVVHTCPVCYPAPPGFLLAQTDSANPGWTYSAGVFIPPVVVTGPPKTQVSGGALA